MFSFALSPIRCATSIILLGLSTVLFATCKTEQANAEVQRTEAFPPNCASRPGEAENCSPLVACFANGDILHGATLGWLKGEVVGETLDGTACRGQWRVSNPRTNTGVARFTCDDGTYGDASFEYDSRTIDRIWGTGYVHPSSDFEVWAGPDLPARLKRVGGRLDRLCEALDGIKAFRAGG